MNFQHKYSKNEGRGLEKAHRSIIAAPIPTAMSVATAVQMTPAPRRPPAGLASTPRTSEQHHAGGGSALGSVEGGRDAAMSEGLHSGSERQAGIYTKPERQRGWYEGGIKNDGSYLGRPSAETGATAIGIDYRAGDSESAPWAGTTTCARVGCRDGMGRWRPMVIGGAGVIVESAGRYHRRWPGTVIREHQGRSAAETLSHHSTTDIPTTRARPPSGAEDGLSAAMRWKTVTVLAW
ncbi:hypothetical protein C8J57DRAFT_1249099 [Mycena rebaudengoi]|nr:hypothetical protein C8J57DRAFT_1249099 [Mycena rebaudengoi]